MLGRFTPWLGVTGEGMTFIVPSTDQVVGRQTFARAAFDLEFMDAAIALVRAECGESVKDRIFLDVGANIGTSAVAALVRFGASRVVAVEPEENNLRLLRANLALNGLHDRADIHEVALSNRSEVGRLGLSPDNPGDHRVSADTSRVGVEISLRQFGDLPLEIDDVGLVWMDVQGHEGHVFDGAGLSLDGVPVVTEFWWDVMNQNGGLPMFADALRRRRGIIDIRSAMATGTASITGPNEVDALLDSLRHKITDLLLLPRVG